MMHLVIDDKIPFMFGRADRFGDCTYLPGEKISAADVKHATILVVRTRTLVDYHLLEGSSVKLVVTATIGHDHIDKAYLEEEGIAWRNCAGCNAFSVAQYVRNVLLLASAQRFITPSFALSEPNHQLTVGIVGMGNVGKAVSEVLAAEGCRVLHCDPFKYPEGCSLYDLAAEADVISLHTPLTTDGPHPTAHLINADFFAHCQRKPFFINSARGECMNTRDVLQALDQGRISGCAIDTWEYEPTISQELLRKSFIATPHIAGYSADGKGNGTRMALQAIADFLHVHLQFNIPLPFFPETAKYGDVPYDVSNALVEACQAKGWPHPSERIQQLAQPAEGESRLSQRALEQLRLYNPYFDDTRLRLNPLQFEWQRGNYPLRREY